MLFTSLHFIKHIVRSYALECSEVKVKVAQNKTTPVKYRYLKNLLKYSNEEVLLRYRPPLTEVLQMV